MEFIHTDCESLLSQIKHQKKQLKRKRRWLMGLPTSKSDKKKLKEPKFLKNRFLSESLLREDDVFFEIVKTCVGKGFGACNVDRGHSVVQDNMQVFGSTNITRTVFSLLDDLTNKGLYLLAKILTGGSVSFEKTRWKMKKVIREHLPKIIRNRNHNYHQMDITAQLSQLLKDPHNFLENRVTLFTPASESHHAAATKVLDGLEDMPFQTLSAMHRKLRGVQGGVPPLQAPKSGWNRDRLINRVRNTCMKMLSELGKGDELQEPLAKAMAVAGLSLKLKLGYQHSFVAEFHQFSPEIEALQNEIAKAIWLLKEKVRFPELKNLQLLLDAKAEVSNGSLRTAIKKLLTEYLFDCSDMDTIPKSLLETLAIINRSSRSTPYKGFSKEEIEEEVECILSVSAQTKQIVWDLLPEHEFDQDFTDAYMEDLEESDDDDGYDDGDQQQSELSQSCSFHFNDSNDQAESFGETKPTDSMSPTTNGNGSSPVLTPNRRSNTDSFERLEREHITGMDSKDFHVFSSSSSSWESKFLNSPQNMDGNQHQVRSMGKLGLTDSNLLTPTAMKNVSSPLFSLEGRLNGNYVERQEPRIDSANRPNFLSSNFSYSEAKFMHDKQSTGRNQYLAVQEVSDETSMIAYRLVGRILDEFAQIGGLRLDSGDRSYLSGGDSIAENSRVATEKRTSSEEEEDVRGSIIVRVVEELIPSFPESGIERVKELMGLQ